MVKTQIYLTQQEYDVLRNTAFQTKKTMSSVIRNLLRKEFKISVETASKPNAGASLLKFADTYGVSGPKDLASNADSYMYGSK